MKIFKKKEKKPSHSEATLEYLYGVLDNYNPTDDEYETILKRIEFIHKVRAAEPAKDKVKKDTALVAGTNLLGILMILNYERAAVVTSKAIGFVTKTKI